MKYLSKSLGLVISLLWSNQSLLLASTEGQTTLLPAKAILDKIVERGKTEEQNDRGFLQHYTFRRIKLNEEWNADGKLKNHERKVSRHIPPKQPLTPVVATRAPAKPDSQPGAAPKSLDRKDFPVDAEMLNRFQFNMVGRELLNGRPTLVLDFKPASKNLPVHSYKDYFLNKAAGRAWVDEKEFVVAKADVHLTEGVGIVGGLAGAVKVFRYQFDRDRTADGFWYAKDLKWHLEVRELLVNRTLEHEEQKLDPEKVQ